MTFVDDASRRALLRAKEVAWDAWLATVAGSQEAIDTALVYERAKADLDAYDRDTAAPAAL